MIGNVIQPNGESSGGGITYSTTETLTGDKWIDGKSIYRKVVDLGNLPNTSGKNVSMNITGNISTIVRYSIMASVIGSGFGYALPIPFVDSSAPIRTTIDIGNKTIEISTTNDRSGWTGFAIVEYTKV